MISIAGQTGRFAGRSRAGNSVRDGALDLAISYRLCRSGSSLGPDCPMCVVCRGAVDFCANACFARSDGRAAMSGYTVIFQSSRRWTRYWTIGLKRGKLTVRLQGPPRMAAYNAIT